MDNFIELPISNEGGHQNTCWKVKAVKIDMETGTCELAFKGWKDNDYRLNGGDSDARIKLPLQDVTILQNFINTYVEFAYICVEDEDSPFYGGRLMKVIPSGAFPSGVLPSGALPSGVSPSSYLPNGVIPDSYSANGDYIIDVTPVGLQIPDYIII